jgi:AI-2 transport protein TqsA
MARTGRPRTPREPFEVAHLVPGTIAPVEQQPQRSRAPRATIALVALAALTITAIGMSGIKGILAPVLLTLVLVICANPVRTYLESKGVPQGVATVSVIIVVFGLLAGFTLLVIVAFAQFVAMLPDYAGQLEQFGARLEGWLSALGFTQQQIAAAAGTVITPSQAAATVWGALGGVASLVTSGVIIFTMMILMSADASYLPTVMHQLGESRPHLVTAMTTYASNVRRYMVVTTVLGVVQGVLNAVALWIMGVPAALLWGVLSFLCSFIPNVGYFFALIPPLVFGGLIGGWPTVIAIIVVYGVINAVVQSIIQPRVVGHAVSLSQTLTFFSVLFWAVVIGPIGAILAIPLTLLGKALLVDSDPDVRLWGPAFGPTAETRVRKRLEDAGLKESRRLARRPVPVEADGTK